MFEKTLLDLVKGIRDHKSNEAQYISECIREIKTELSSSDKDLKAVALSKLTYVCVLARCPYHVGLPDHLSTALLSLPVYVHVGACVCVAMSPALHERIRHVLGRFLGD
jgi:hypothetical protein